MIARLIRAVAVVVLGLCFACSVQAKEPGHGVELTYGRLNASFLVRLPNNKVESIYLNGPSKHVSSSVGANEVVLGSGAYGVKLGDPENALDTLRITASRDVARRPDFSGYDFELSGDRRLIVNVRHDHVASLIVAGSFRTHEGVTQNSTRADVIRVYGMPDHTSKWTFRRVTFPSWVRWLMVIATGAIAGIILRRMMRARTGALQRFLYGLVVGAAVSMATGCLGYMVHGGFSILWAVGRSLAPVSVAGAVGGGVFALLWPYTTSVPRTLPVFVATWAAWFVSEYGAFLLFMGVVSIRYFGAAAATTALSAFALCLFGRQATTQAQAEMPPAVSDA